MSHFEVVYPKGVSYRTAPALEAKAQDRIPARRGDVVVGEVADNWIATEEGLYLPLRAPDGTQLLRRKPERVPWQGCDDPADSLGPYPAAQEARIAPAKPPTGLSELDALHTKYDKKYGGPKKGGNGGLGLGPMANSHVRHTEYMQDFRQGLEEMGMDTRNDPYLNAYAPSSASRPGSKLSSAGASLAGSGSSRPGSRASSGGVSGNGRANSSSGSRRPLISRGGSGTIDGSGQSLSTAGALRVNRSEASGSVGTWTQGPANAILPVKEWTSVKHGKEVLNSCSSGRVVDLSDRNIMCMSLMDEKAVLGSADHGLKEVNVRAGQITRTLYTKRFGHTEWVTTVSHCSSGKIISGALDSKLCLWNASGVSCVDLTGHLGSISRVRAHAQEDLAVSSGYDRTLRAWDLKKKNEVGCCKGHDAPITEFIWADDVIASGDRGGTVRVFDARRAEHIAALRGHKGHITAMMALPQICNSEDQSSSGSSQQITSPTSLIATGAQDGHIRIWDLRQRLNTFTLSAHPGGAVNEMGVALGSGQPIVVSVGADGRLIGLDPRKSFAPLFDFADITVDFVYSLLVLDDLVFTGDGRGKVKCFDVRSCQQRYTLDAGQNAIRCLGATSTCLICAGDDGNAVIFDF
eukprot:TRINITY_DN24166_c0_g1_i1.p1 TRINITY_DN24166_c0_g1~~TRINITY_DN24166_c0_g1_i1.p1  ORF type:complete len:634 (+),score=99.35 TRINITY_DN24166_c0_g1_i1:67-1968(+)